MARLLFFLPLLLWCALCGDSILAAELHTDKNYLEVTNLDPEQQRFVQRLKSKQLDNVFTIAVLDEQGGLLGQVWGEVEKNRRGLRFTPRFPFDNNRQYQATVQLGGSPYQALRRRFSFNSDQSSSTQLTAVYPSGSELPENLFKFYLYFSHPMARGEAYQHIRLLDENNRPVELPFLELTQELWDPSGKRFTLLFDPGRTKQGIKPNRDMGLPLQAGKQFTLVIDRQWKDATGLPLTEAFRKTFTVVAQDHQQPDINRWALTLPTSGYRNPVIIQFDEPMDRAQLENAIWIERDGGKVIAGEVEIEDELVWRFTPTLGWRSGEYRVVARSYLEDRAANSLGRLFEVIRTDEDVEIPDTFSLEFEL